MSCEDNMKLVRYGGHRIGLIDDTSVKDISDLAGATADEWPPVAMNRLIRDFAVLRPEIEKARSRPGTPLKDVKLMTPVPWPNKVIAYPVNYHDHGAEMGAGYRANTQGFFLKPSSSLSGASEPIVLPAVTGRRIDHECELAIVIGKEGRDVPRDRWRNYVFGYSCLVDVSVRGKEERVARKAADTFCPVGPWIVTADEIADPANLRGRLWVNDELRQDANTKDWVLDLPGMIEMASAIMTLYPGDIIAAGTPAGVGPIKAGDKVRIHFEQVGEMTLDVVQGKTGSGSIFKNPPE
jgi:2-keto-4-pentenoate hydratase/2-oxohepta-3-ene-1,7-dioic acid hydratase in catechol pathway